MAEQIHNTNAVVTLVDLSAIDKTDIVDVGLYRLESKLMAAKDQISADIKAHNREIKKLSDELAQHAKSLIPTIPVFSEYTKLIELIEGTSSDSKGDVKLETSSRVDYDNNKKALNFKLSYSVALTPVVSGYGRERQGHLVYKDVTIPATEAAVTKQKRINELDELIETANSNLREVVTRLGRMDHFTRQAKAKLAEHRLKSNGEEGQKILDAMEALGSDNLPKFMLESK